jgi:pyrroline-5-carboxylate reductase
MQKKITFIGAGNMASSLIGGLVADGYDPKLITATDPNQEKLQNLQKKFNIQTTSNNIIGIAEAEIIVLAIKPQNIKNVVQEITVTVKQKKPLIMSIAAMIPVAHLEKWLGLDIAIVRCMPNLAALVRSAITALYANDQVNQEQKNLAESIMRAVGITFWINDETQMNGITALSGSGPAYFFLLMEILQTHAEKIGLPQETAKLLALETALGATRLALETSVPVNVLRQQVTSPGGVTEAALKILESRDIRKIFADAVDTACERSKEIADSIKD